MTVIEWVIAISGLTLGVILWIRHVRDQRKLGHFIAALPNTQCPTCSKFFGSQRSLRPAFQCPKDYFYHDDSVWPIRKEKVSYDEVYAVKCPSCQAEMLIATNGNILEIHPKYDERKGA